MRLLKIVAAALGLVLGLAGVAVMAAEPQGIAIVGATVIDGNGGPAQPDMTVLVQGGRIARMGPAAEVHAPRGFQVIDARGRFLTPGFIDNNVHATVYGKPERRDTTVKYAGQDEALALEFVQRELKYGVTTSRDSYGDLPALIAVRDRINRGEAVGARLLVAGNILGWGGPFSLTFSLTKEADLSLFQEKWNDRIAAGGGEDLMDMTPEELGVAMDRYIDQGPDFIKYGGTSHFFYPSLIGFSPRQQKVIVDRAHARGLRVETHATSSEGLRLAVEAGIDLIQHPEMLSRDYPDDLIALIQEKKPLCGMRANMVAGEDWKKHLAKRAEAEARLKDAPPPATTAEMRRRREKLGEDDEIAHRNAIRLIKAGCRVAIATDAYQGDAPEFRREPKPLDQEPGLAALIAIENLVELGMTPSQAIMSGTRNGAIAAGKPDQLGTVETGKIADLVLLSADPLADISNIRRQVMVMSKGKIVDVARLPEHPIFYRGT
jgi:imidazolonepropionase-like amidohydrolase